MRVREYLGPSSFALRRSLRVLKSIPCMGIVVFEPIPRRRGDWQSGVVLIIRTHLTCWVTPVLSLMV